MSTRQIKAGSTDQSVTLRIVDSTTGAPETGVLFNTTGMDLWYRREGAAKVSITEATLASLSAAHSDGGFLEIGDGWYRLDLPDAAVASGVAGVQVGGTVTGMVVFAPYIELVAYNPYDAVRLGLTALPNADADAAGGLPISDAGGLDLDAKLANTNEITAARMGALTDWIDGGRLDLILDIIAADTTTDIPALIATAQADLDIITGADGVNLLSGTQASIDAIEVDTGTTLDGKLNVIDAIVDAILVDTGTTIPALIAALQNLSSAEAQAACAAALTAHDIATETKQDVIDNVVDAIKAKTDQLAFTVANQVDSNVQSVNEQNITGDGGVGTEFQGA